MTGTETNPIRVLNWEHILGVRDKTIYCNELHKELLDNWKSFDRLCKQNKVKIEVAK